MYIKLITFIVNLTVHSTTCKAQLSGIMREYPLEHNLKLLNYLKCCYLKFEIFSEF